MRRISRLERSIDLVMARSSIQSSSKYLCTICRNRAAPFSTSSLRPAKPYTEKIRSKIWGTEHPPGQEDPYGDQSKFDQTKKRQKEEELKEEELKEAELEAEKQRKPVPKAATADMSTYEAATTWGDNQEERLAWVGGYGHWWKNKWDPDHQFSAFVPKVDRIMKNPDQITAAFYRALVEVYAYKQAGLPLTASSTSSHWDPSNLVQIRPTENGVDLEFTEGNSLSAFTQSLKPSRDETAEHENPSESEENVAADRSTVDPLRDDTTQEPVEQTSVEEDPTEIEEDIDAERSSANLMTNWQRDLTYENFVKSLGTSWHQVSLADPELKFAVGRVA